MNRKKVIIIAPNFYGIDKSICHAFESLGFNTALLNSRPGLSLFENISLRMSRKFPFSKNILNKNIQSFLVRDNNGYLLSIKKFKPDIIFIIKGETVFPETIQIIKNEMKIPCIAYMWDRPFYTYADDFLDDYRKNNFALGMHLYDYIFVYDPYYVEEIKKKGIANVGYLPLATDPGKYKKVGLSQKEKQEYALDICFVGWPLPNRVEVFENLSGFKLGVFGDGWKDWHRFKKSPIYYKGKAIGEKVLKIYSSSKIVLNMHHPQSVLGVNTRTFDILACGAFELVDFKPELEKLFVLGDEIVCYKNIGELKGLIKFYLENEEERRRIAKRGMDKVLSCHTWHNRIKGLIAALSEKRIL